MKLFLCRWPNGDCSVVVANNKADAIKELDEVDNAEGCPMTVLNDDFMVHFKLGNDGELEFGGFGECTHETIYDFCYPTLGDAPTQDDVARERQRVKPKAVAPRQNEFGKRTPFPRAIIPFILANVEGFDAYLDGDRIVIAPRNGAVIKHASRFAILPTETVTPALPKPILRPKFFYRAEDRAKTPELAKRMGFSDQRLKVYTVIFGTKDPRGVQSKDVMERTGLPHGTVQQILHWLRKQQWITGEPTDS